MEQRNIFKKLHVNKKKSIWIHCASLGEYEQVKPLIKQLRDQNQLISLTFFSSSGYLYFNDFHLITQLSYLPLDIKSKMNRFIQIINPNMVIISKNDIWPNMLTCLNKKEIPVYLLGCKLNQHKINNWIIRQYYKKYLTMFSYIFCQDSLTFEFLKSQKIYNSSVIGDMRIDQVIIDSKEEYQNSKISHFIKNKKVILYGSVEKNDYQVILNTINSRKDISHIIVPHDINRQKIKDLTNKIESNWTMYSEMEDRGNDNSNVLIVDEFGILKELYRYSIISYVGGGFDHGVHNTLEPAIHKNLLLFGPKYKNFSETKFFVRNNIAYSINDKNSFENKLNLLLNYKEKHKTDKLIESFFSQKKQTLNYIVDKLIF